MRRALLVWIWLVGALAAPAAAQDWSRFRPEDGASSVEFPGAPKYEAVPIEGGYTLHQWQVDGGAVAYTFTYIDYRPGHVADAGIETILDNLTAGSRETGELVSERRIQIGGSPGREVIVRASADLILRQRHIVVGDRAYIWNYVGPTGTEGSQNATRFLASLNLHR